MDRRWLATVLIAGALYGTLSPRQAVGAPPPAPARAPQSNPSAAKGTAWSWLKSKAAQMLPASSASKESPAPSFDAQTPPAGSQESMAHFSWTFADVEATTVVDRLASYGVQLPVEVQGRLTIAVTVGVPWQSPLSSAEYDLDGSLTSARLTVAGVEVSNVSARLKHDQGWLTLEHLKFEIEDAAHPQRSGAVSGSAEMQLTPPGDLTARLALDRVPLAEARSLLSDLAIDLSGQASGRAEARVAVERLHDRSAWRVRGNVSTHAMQAAGLPPVSLRTEMELADGVLHARQLAGEAEHTRLTGSGRLNIVAPFDYSADLHLATGKLSHLNGLPDELKLPLEIHGSFGAAVRLNGSLGRKLHAAAGTVTAPVLLLKGVKLEQLQFSFDANQDRVHIHPLNAGVYDGRIDLSLAMPWGGADEIKAGLRWSRLPVHRLARDAAGIETVPHGASSGVLQLQLPAGKWTQPETWQAHGKIDLHQPAAAPRTQTLRLPRATANVHLRAGRLQIRDLSLASGASRLTGSVELQIGSPFAYRLNLQATDVDLALVEPLAKAWRSSARLGGRLTASADLQGSLNPLRVNGQGLVDAKQARFGTLQADALRWQFVADQRHLEIRQLQAELFGGRVDGALSVALSEREPSEATLEWRQLDLKTLLQGAAAAAADVAGSASGSFHGAAPPGKLFEPKSWQGQTRLAIPDLTLAGLPAMRVELHAKAADGVLTVAKFSGCQESEAGKPSATMQASGSVKLAAPFAFRAAVRLDGFELASLEALPQGARPPLDVRGKLSTRCEAEGALAPLAVSAQGAAGASKLQMNSAELDALHFDFLLEPKSLLLESIKASFDGGQAAGELLLPLAEDVAGRATLTLKQIDLGRLVGGLARLPLRVEGRADARVDARIPPGQLRSVGEWNVQASLDAANIAADSIPLGGVHARLTSGRELVHYRLTGEALDGKLDLKGEWRLPDAEHPQGINQGRLKLQELQLRRVGELLRRRGSLESLDGVASVEFDYRHDDESGLPLGMCRVEADDIRFNDERLADRVRIAALLTGERIEVEHATGELAEGRFAMRGATRLGRDRRSDYRAELYGAELKRLLLAWPSLAAHSRGAADLALRFYHRRGGPFRLRGKAQLRDGELGELLVPSLRTPIEINVDSFSGRRELHLRGLVLETSPGRASGDVHVVANNQLQLDVKGKLTNVHLQKAIRRSPRYPKATGRISGTFQLNGRNVRSVRDLDGRILVKLRDARGLPGMEQAGSHTGGGLSSATQFSEGDVRATMSRGVMRFERLSLAGRKTQVYATGQAALGGRVDLDVTVNTNLLNPAAQGALSLATQLSLLAAPPLALLLEANQFLSNQVVHLKVSGTMRSPSIHVRPLPLLGEEAVRFFLMEAPAP